VTFWLPVAGVMATMYYLAGIAQIPGGAGLSDTVLHIAGYAGLSLLTLRATARGRWSGVTVGAIGAAFLIAVVHGLTIELEQMFVPSRVAEWRDVVNDVIGALAALLLVWAWSKIRRA